MPLDDVLPNGSDLPGNDREMWRRIQGQACGSMDKEKNSPDAKVSRQVGQSEQTRDSREDKGKLERR